MNSRSDDDRESTEGVQYDLALDAELSENIRDAVMALMDQRLAYLAQPQVVVPNGATNTAINFHESSICTILTSEK